MITCDYDEDNDNPWTNDIAMFVVVSLRYFLSASIAPVDSQLLCGSFIKLAAQTLI